MPGIEQDWLHLPNADHGKGLEVILQAHTLAGFPRTINALIKVHELGLHPEGTKHFDEHHNIDSWRKDGLNTLNAIYGPVSEKMRANFRKMHPLLESILVEHIYGRVLSRPLVGLRMRELCTLSIVAGQNLPLQLVSHLRGAIRSGATRDEVFATVEQVHLVWGDAAQQQARAVRDVRWSSGRAIADEE